MSTTIVAIATPIGVGGVGVIRLSGPDSLEILKKVFKPIHKTTFPPRYMVFGNLEFDGVCDDCLAVYFKAPQSFTGEDVVEIQMHGGIKLLEETVKCLIKNGATMAEPGEFSKRAVLNGKMDITEAEGLIDIIYAKTLTEMRVASSHMRGDLYKKIVSIQNGLTNLLAEIEVALDYPEHEEQVAEENIQTVLPELIHEIKTLENTSEVGNKIKNGVNVAIVGKPNVGKSSLLNALLGYDRAIVTNIAGTTRDTINEGYVYKNMQFNITDTAGIHQTNDQIEQEGIKRSLQSVEESDIVVFLYDSDKKDDEYAKILTHKPQNSAKVLNKIDVLNDFNPKNFDLCISSKEKQGIVELKELIYQKTVDKSLLGQEVIITNIRHQHLLQKALTSLEKAQKDVGFMSLELISVLIREAWTLLGQITGETSNEKVIDTIFSKFCLGK